MQTHWVIIQGEGDDNEQANHMQHKANMEDISNNRTVPHTAGHEKHGTSRRHIHRNKPTEHNKAFNLYKACTQVNTNHSDKQEDTTSNQWNREISGDTDLINGRQVHGNRNEGPETKATQSKQKSRSGEIRTVSGCMSQKPK